MLKFDIITGYTPVVGNPSCLQATAASLLSQELEHIYPNLPPIQTSRVPLVEMEPLTNLISVSLQTGAKQRDGENMMPIFLQ